MLFDAFEFNFNRVLDYEKQWSNDPQDRGGKTKWGITESEFKYCQNLYKFDSARIEDLTKAEARLIYLLEYWNKVKGDEIKSASIAGELFDTAVNMGVHAAIRIAQKALNYLGEKLKEDGIIGPLTINAINHWCERDKRALFIAMNGFQFMEYVAISESQPENAFPRGWTRRIQQYTEINNLV